MDENMDLPFEIDDEPMDTPSLDDLMCYYYTTTECGFIGDAYGRVKEGLDAYPDNPDILSFLVIYAIKRDNADRVRHGKDYVSQIKEYKFIDKLLSLPADELTLRAYTASIISLIYLDEENNEERVKELIRRMKRKFPCDIACNYADMLYEHIYGLDISDASIDELRKAYEVLSNMQVVDDRYSDYITSFLPLIEMVIDELYYPRKPESQSGG